MEPRDYAARAEAAALPGGNEERFSGWGVMGLPFRSGHILGLRRFPASSVGPGYTSVWHRSPDERWTFYSDVPALQSCNRYFGADVDEFIETEVVITWPGLRTLTVSIPEAGLELTAIISATVVTRVLNAVGSIMPDGLWKNRAVLGLMAPVAGSLLGAGRIRMHGHAPNGQAFVANALRMWTIDSADASLRGEAFGPPGPVSPQARLADFMIPQRGMFVIGRAFFDPFDAQRHRSSVTRAG